MIKRIIVIIFAHILSSQIFAAGASELENEELSYNEALQLYYSEDYENSGRILSELDFSSDQSREVNKLMLQSALEFRLGENAAQESGDFTGALLNMERSIGYLKRALELNENHEVAANNLEVAMKMKEAMARQKETEHKDRHNENSLQNELDQLKEDQQRLADESRKDSSEHKSQQNDLKDRTESIRNENEEGEDFNKHMENAERAQQAAAEALANDETDKAREYQNEAVQHLENASSSISEGESDPPGRDEQDEGDSETDQLIQSIIDSEKSRSESSEQSGSGIAVERNW